MSCPESYNQQPTLDPEFLQELVENCQPGECFPIVDGFVGTAGWTNDIQVAAYSAPLEELFDYQSLRYHAGVSRGFIGATEFRQPEAAETATVTLAINKGSKFSAQTPDLSYSVLKGTITGGSYETPVLIVRIKLPTRHYDYWLMREN